MLFYTILAVAALSLVFTFSASAADPVPAAGAPAPKFQLPSEDGTPISLDQYKGKWVVLYFYPKDFTSGCTVEAHNFQRDLDKYKALNAVILGVSVDSADSHKQFCAKEGLNFKLLADEKHEVTDKYGSTMTYGDKTLAARNTFIIGPDGSIKKVYTGVKPSTHSEEVLAALNDLGAKK
jgi:peroxiredoxin Q/BCP